VDQYCIRNSTDFIDSILQSIGGTLDVCTWLINIYCPWNCSLHVNICILRVPSGFVIFKIIGGIVLLFMGGLVAASYLKEEYRREIFICGRLFQISAQIVK